MHIFNINTSIYILILVGATFCNVAWSVIFEVNSVIEYIHIYMMYYIYVSMLIYMLC